MTEQREMGREKLEQIGLLDHAINQLANGYLMTGRSFEMFRDIPSHMYTLKYTCGVLHVKIPENMFFSHTLSNMFSCRPYNGQHLKSYPHICQIVFSVNILCYCSVLSLNSLFYFHAKLSVLIDKPSV